MIWFEPPDQLASWDYVVPNVLSDADIADIEAYVAERPDKLQPAEIRSGDGNAPIDNSLRRTDVLFLEDKHLLPDVYNNVINTALGVNNIHFKYSLSYLQLLQYSVYDSKVQGCYDIHCDTTCRNTNGFTRKVSFSILLNDPSEFVGGELLFHVNKTPAVANLQKGSMVLFPSFIPHSVAPVTKGVRRSLVGWICGPNFV